jgi:hypothetical protein
MNKLILSLLLLPYQALAADEMQTRVETKFLTVVKDVEVERLVGNSAEFNECRDLNKFVKGATAGANLKLATDCFQKKIGTKDPASLKKLAEDLKLKDYGLIKSKNVSDITEYLTKKLHKSLTGVDLDAKNNAPQKWEDQKIVDQKVFVELYKNQLAKNALFEISRFCFENLRLEAGSTATDFTTYWTGNMPAAVNKVLPITGLTDEGVDNIFFPGTLKDIDLNDEKEVYAKLVSGLTPGKQPIDAKLFGDFFSFCTQAIKPMCEAFKDKIKSSTPIKIGANACLTFNKLEAIRTTLRNTEKVAKQFDEMEDKGTFAIQMIKNPKIYQNGKGAGEESLDELTSVGSADFLHNSQTENDKLKDLETNCATNSSSSECKQFLQVDDGKERALNDLEMDIDLKGQIEVTRVKKLKDKELKDYLKENRHFDLLERLDSKDANKLTETDIVNEIGFYYEAKKASEMAALKSKIGTRQVSEKEAATDADKTKFIVKNIKESKEERARLAQVVMFNNIITSQLELKKDVNGTSESLGRNVSGWNKEKAGLDKIQGINSTVFEGVQSNAKENGVKTKESIADVGFLDDILGKDTTKKD